MHAWLLSNGLKTLEICNGIRAEAESSLSQVVHEEMESTLTFKCLRFVQFCYSNVQDTDMFSFLYSSFPVREGDRSFSKQFVFPMATPCGTAKFTVGDSRLKCLEDFGAGELQRTSKVRILLTCDVH